MRHVSSTCREEKAVDLTIKVTRAILTTAEVKGKRAAEDIE